MHGELSHSLVVSLPLLASHGGLQKCCKLFVHIRHLHNLVQPLKLTHTLPSCSSSNL